MSSEPADVNTAPDKTNWKLIYGAVLAFLALQIILYALISSAFA